MQNGRDRLAKAVRIVFVVICIGLYFAFIIYNICTNNKFWEASAVNCLTIGVAIVISYYLVQKQNDRRKQKDIVLDLIMKIQALISQRSAYDFEGQDTSEITMRLRDLNNKVHILEAVKDRFQISNEVEFIRNKYDEYSNFIGDNIGNLDYLLQSQRVLKRPIELIDSKLVEIALKLYE